MVATLSRPSPASGAETSVSVNGTTYRAQVSQLNGGTLLQAHNQWASRPRDQRFTSLEHLLAATQRHRTNAFEGVLPLGKLRIDAQAGPSDAQEVLVNGVPMTWYAFGRLAGLAGAPASYLRSLPAPLAVANLRHGLEQRVKQETIRIPSPEPGQPALTQQPEYKLLAQRPSSEDPKGRIAALTSPAYGRIWDADVVQAIIDVNERNNGIWKVPSAAYGGEITSLSTTLYGSDHDVFMFLVDGERTIEDKRLGPGTAINRGFIVWNSEVGDRTLGILTFLFSYVCQNRMIWGAEDVTQMLIRHSSAGPRKFTELAPPILQQYAAASAQPVIEMIAQARTLFPAKVEFDPLATDKETQRKPVVAYLRDRGFNRSHAEAGVAVAEAQDPATGIDPSANPYSAWNLVQGLTAMARAIEYADERVEVEKRAGKLLELTNVQYRIS